MEKTDQLRRQFKYKILEKMESHMVYNCSMIKVEKQTNKHEIWYSIIILYKYSSFVRKVLLLLENISSLSLLFVTYLCVDSKYLKQITSHLLFLGLKFNIWKFSVNVSNVLLVLPKANLLRFSKDTKLFYHIAY